MNADRPLIKTLMRTTRVISTTIVTDKETNLVMLPACVDPSTGHKPPPEDESDPSLELKAIKHLEEIYTSVVQVY